VAEDVSERVLLQAGDILVVSNKRCLHAWDRGGRRRHRAAEGAVAQHVRQPRGELLAVARGAVRPPPSATGPGSAWGEGGDGASPPRLSGGAAGVVCTGGPAVLIPAPMPGGVCFSYCTVACENPQHSCPSAPYPYRCSQNTLQPSPKFMYHFR
ncbi:unnamed protein product, partial [Prorocentrum cordatum]